MLERCRYTLEQGGDVCVLGRTSDACQIGLFVFPQS